MKPVELLLERLEGARELNGFYRAFCPAHNDRNTPNLDIKEGDEGQALVICRAGCKTEEVVGALELEMSDLFTVSTHSHRNGHEKGGGKPTAVWEIRDLEGELQAEHVRYDLSGGRKKCLWRMPGAAGWGLEGRKHSTLPLYRSELLKEWPEDVPVVVVEGEKAADALAGVYPAVLGTVTGAEGYPGPEVLEFLRGRAVVLWPDADGSGSRHMRRIAGALEEAVKGDLIPRNPAAHANKPKVKQEEIEPLDAEQAATFLKAARGDRFEVLYVLCLMCGLRQGEALALRWQDVDLEGETLRVNRQLQRVRGGGGLRFSEPKNASRRTVGLPRRAVSALRSHRKRQLEDQLRAGALWQDNGLVFTNLTGGPLDAQNIVNRSYKPLLKRAGLPAIRFHDLRHSCLSLLAQRGEPIRDLQALAGHATAAFTLQRYTHHYDASARRTADAMGDIFPEEP